MTVTVSRLAQHIGTRADNEALPSCLAEAGDLVAQRVGPHEVPGPILERATLEAAADLYHRSRSHNGVVEFADDGAQPIRIARDPMLTAYAILAPWLPGGFA